MTIKWILGFNPYAKQVVWLVLLTGIITALLACVRTYSLLYFNLGFYEVVANADFWAVLWQGLRFDVATVIRLFLPVYLLSLMALLLPRRVGLWLTTIGVCWGIILAACILLLTVANVGYIGFFDTPFNAFAIESLTYDKHEIAESVLGAGDVWWYLVVGVVLAVFSVSVLWRLAKLLNAHWPKGKTRFIPATVFVVCSFLLVIALGRGSLGNFPLSHKHLVVSANPSFNNSVPNGALSVYYAILEYLDSRDLKLASDEGGRALYQQFYGKPAMAGDLWSQLFTATPESSFLANNPPNVVLNLVESMGTEPLLSSFNEGADLVGDLGVHLQADVWLKNFLPEHNDTQSTLIRLLGNIDYPTVTQSKYKRIALQTAAARVFKRAGYTTVFVYTGFEGVRHRADYFLNQGFDRFIGAHQLQQAYPKMPTNVWGGEDAYMYDYASKLLLNHNKDDAPLFVVTLTTTNHPPYHVPTSFAAHTSIVNPDLAKKIGGLPVDSLATYKYTNHHLGQFIAKIKASSNAANTIVAATGDHGVRGLTGFEGSALRNVSVPLYFYVPENYKPDQPLNSTQVASHKDVFPTLYHLALSGASYPNLGRNLYAAQGELNPHGFAASSRYIVSNEGAVLKSKPGVVYPLVPGQGLRLGSPKVMVPNQKLESALSYEKLINWMMRKQLVGGS